MSRIIDYIDQCTCLVLDQRYHQWLEIKNTANKLGLFPDCFLAGSKILNKDYGHIDDCEVPSCYPGRSISYATWYNRPNAYNAWKSHKKIFQKAIDDDAKNLLLLEDDVVFTDDFMEILGKFEVDLVNLDEIDMIYLGSYGEPNVIDSRSHTYRMNGGGGFHGVIINRKILDILVKLDPLGPFDWMVGKMHSQFNCLAIKPDIIMQRDGYSYVEGHHLDKPKRKV